MHKNKVVLACILFFLFFFFHKRGWIWCFLERLLGILLAQTLTSTLAWGCHQIFKTFAASPSTGRLYVLNIQTAENTEPIWVPFSSVSLLRSTAWPQRTKRRSLWVLRHYLLIVRSSPGHLDFTFPSLVGSLKKHWVGLTSELFMQSWVCGLAVTVLPHVGAFRE